MRIFQIRVAGDLLRVELPVEDRRADGTLLKRHAIRATLQHEIKRVLDSRPSTLMVVPEGTTIEVDGLAVTTPCAGWSWRVARWVAEQVV